MGKMWPSRQCRDGDSEARLRSEWTLPAMEVSLLARTRDRGPAT